MKRTRIKPKRSTPRRREAPRWDADQWEAANKVLHKRCRGRCERCGGLLGYHTERHHRIRRRDGGDRFANILMLHSQCHQWVTEHPESARNQGWILPAETRNPAACPVWHAPSGHWVLLNDDGTTTLLPGEQDSTRTTPCQA